MTFAVCESGFGDGGYPVFELVDGKRTEGTFRSHQVPMGEMSRPGHVKILEKWLKSYRPQELFGEDGSPRDDVLAPARARGYAAIWLVGISIGGFWSLSTAILARLASGSDLPKAIALLQGGTAFRLYIKTSYFKTMIGQVQ